MGTFTGSEAGMKGDRTAEFDVKVKLRTLGGMGTVTIEVKAKEGHKVIREYEFPFSGFFNKQSAEPVSRRGAEELFAEMVSNLEVSAGSPAEKHWFR